MVSRKYAGVRVSRRAPVLRGEGLRSLLLQAAVGLLLMAHLPPLPAQDSPVSAEVDASSAVDPAPATDMAEPVAADPGEALGVIALPQPAPAPLPEAGQAAPVFELETVVVTAQKRVQRLQDVPIAVQAFTPETLAARGIVNQTGLQQATPGLDVGEQAQFSTLFLRGVGSDAFLMADPSVASYIDGIYFPFAQGQAQDFGAVERVEVVKGPQGTLFGRNALGGAISVITRDPDLFEPQTSVELGYGSRDNVEARVYQNLPLAQTLAANVSGYFREGEHYMRGLAAGEPLADERSRGGRLKLRWAPSDNLDVIVAGVRTEQAGTGSVFTLNNAPTAVVGSLLLGIEPQTGYSGELSQPTFLDFENTVFYGQASYFSPWFDIKLLGSDQRVESVFTYDFDGSPRAGAAFDQKLNFADIQTAELQLVSNENTWGASRFEWVLGAYYFRSEQGFDTANLQLFGLDLADFQRGGISLPDLAIDALDELNLRFPNGDVAFHAIIGTDSRSVYAQGSYTFTDWLGLTLGARYQDEERRIIRSDSGLFLSDGGFQTLFDWNRIGARDGDGNPYPTTDTTTSLRPKATLELRPFGRDTLVYLSYQEALKSGTYNTIAIYQRPQYVKPEEIEAWEIGLKTSTGDGGIRFNIAAFDYQITNFQVQFISLLQGGAVSFENADAASIRGVDFELQLDLWPSHIEDFRFTVGAAFLDSEYDRYVSASGFDPDTGLFSSDNDYTGNRVVRTPEFTGSATLTKAWSVPGGRLRMGADGYCNDGFFYASSNAPNLEQARYRVFGAHLSYLYARWGLSATLFGRNLADEKYSQGLIATDFGANVTLAAPRTYGLRLNWEF